MLFNLLVTTVAEAAVDAAQENPYGWVSMVAIYGGLFVVMYFVMFHPQRKARKKEEALRNSIQVGDEIVTSSGIVGRIVSLKEDSIMLETGADRSKIRIMRWAVQQNLTIHD